MWAMGQKVCGSQGKDMSEWRDPNGTGADKVEMSPSSWLRHSLPKHLSHRQDRWAKLNETFWLLTERVRPQVETRMGI